ncbi:MAG: hypothetical protein E2O56_01820 [Gammaproteobacteria bacterium]|nr:MAG: hypothetical protein E2O56_01820 [Gammaproteobacteria bacterium]
MNQLLSIVLISGLAVFVFQSMGGFTDKARFTEVMQVADGMKKAVTICGQINSGFNNCDDLKMGGAAAGNVSDIQDIDVTDGVITIVFMHDENRLTYVLTPALSDGIVRWTAGGTCSAGLCDATPGDL